MSYIYLKFNLDEIIRDSFNANIRGRYFLKEEFLSDIKDVLVEEHDRVRLIRLKDKELAAYLKLKYDMIQVNEYIALLKNRDWTDTRELRK